MSYLSPLRLHFAGRFQANVSTVNNDTHHFDNSSFQASYQQLQGVNMNPPNGWFNPQGDADWRFLGCKVTSIWLPSGQGSSSDPALACVIADSGARVPAKLVDLDPEQQLVSEIWGLQVRIADANGNTLLRGEYEPAAFIDIWDRATVSAGGDTDAGAMYQSVLSNLQWGDVSSSPFLTALQAASAASGLLSIKFNVDGFNMDYTSPEFMTGRIAGTIGPASASEPHHMLFGRYFMAGANAGGNFFKPPGQINFCTAVVDAVGGNIYLDLGNALPTGAGGGMVNLGDLTLSAYSPIASAGNPAGSTQPIGTIAAAGAGGYASDPTWYARTAGVVVLPVTAGLLPIVQSSQLLLSSSQGASISEWSSSAYVRADTFVFRLSPSGTPAQISVYAMQFGKPVPAGTQIAFVADASQLQAQPGYDPPVATPSVLTFSPAAQVATDANGCAVVTVTASDPGSPRNFNIGPTNPTGDYGIDGQVYGVRPGFVDTQTFGNQPINQWNFISFLVWTAFQAKVPAQPTWYDDLQPVFQQYANLYPVMSRFLNLASYDSVRANVGLLSLAFGLAVSDPNSMPVTRDLSPAKRAAILLWLQNGMPLGNPPARAATLTRAAPPQARPPTLGAPPVMIQGGKAAAASRRIVVWQYR